MSQLVPGNSFGLKDDYSLYSMYPDSNFNKKVLGGLNCGEPTRTTPTLTPTTLSYIEQELGSQCHAETHQNQAGFEPPLIQPLSQGNNVFMSLVDTKSWQGGSAVVGEPNSIQSENLRNVITSTMNHTTNTTTRRNTGGRRPNKDKNISPEEEERRQVRRERNKLAAARCRKRRLDHTNELQEETDELEGKKQDLQKEIKLLQQEKIELEYILEAHKGMCRLNEPGSPKDVKPFASDLSEKILIGGAPIQIKQEQSVAAKSLAQKKQHPSGNGPRQRPSSLPVPSVFIPRKTSGSPDVIVGIPIDTPTNGIPFNFDSLMEGGTGLTPPVVSASLVPSCSSQQRNSSCGDLSSPDSVPTKLVSL